MQHEAAHGKDSHSRVSRTLTGLAIGGVVLGASVALAPHILPAIGISSAGMAEESLWVLHTRQNGMGLAGILNNLLKTVPIAGESLAAGGLYNAATTGLIGIGGVLLGNFIARKEDGSKRVKWGNVIKYGALLTSALIAMPTVLTAIGSGLIFLSTLAGETGITNSVISFVDNTIGTMGAAEHAMMGLSGIAAAIPHFLTCGMALLPAALTFTLARDDKKIEAAESAIVAEVQTLAPPAIGVPTTATLKLKHAVSGKPLTEDELAVVHTKKLHLFVADQSLKDYQHIHPEPTQEPGVFSFTFTPGTSNRYSAWADFTTLEDQKNYRLKSEFPHTSRRSIPPVVRVNKHAVQSGLAFNWEATAPLRQGEAGIVEITVRDTQGKPVMDLDPVLGAAAHLVGFSADGKALVHAHPLSGGDPSRLRFHIEAERAGATQFFLQVSRHGQDIFAPFGQLVLPPEKAVDKLRHPSHDRPQLAV